jgi:putative cell wall-binding protein
VGGLLSAALVAAGVTVVPSVVPAASAGVAVERVAGADRYATSIAVSRRGWPNGSSVVVLAGGRDHRDALSASGLAGLAGHAPVLLTQPDVLRDDTRAELTRLHPSRVFIVGGTAAVSAMVEDAVRGVVGAVTRRSGDDAPSTAAAVATASGFAPRASVLRVDAGDAAAGVVAGALAAAKGWALLLTAGGAVPASTQSALDSLSPAHVYAVGAAAAVPAGGAERVAGDDVFSTGTEVAALGVRNGVGANHAVVASQWSDGMSAAALAGAFNVPLLLTHPTAWHGALDGWYRFWRPAGTTIVGGEAAVDAIVEAVIAEGGGSPARRYGSSGPVVSEIQRRLVDIGFHPGNVEGRYDTQTRFALYALQKAFGLPVTGDVGGSELDVLARRERPPVLRPDITASHGDHVEISIARQLVQVVRNGAVLVSVHTSTGKPSTPTIIGLFRILDHRPGFNADGMYKTMHFSGGYAIHGYDPVPLYPASHGCARVTYSDADLLFDIVPNGMPVIVWR